MPLRIILALGPPFGGFRIAFRPSVVKLDWPEGCAVLERAVLEDLRRVAALSPERRARLHDEPLPWRPGPQLGARVGVIDGMIIPEADGVSVIVMCARFRFAFWPFGSWAVYEAGRVTPDGRLALVSDEELNQYW